MRYKRGFKFVSVDIETAFVGIFPPKSIYFQWGTLSENGFLTVEAGYPWNGMSGIPMNIPSSIKGVFFHDVIYRMIRLGLIGIEWKAQGDNVIRDFCIRDGMLKILANTIHAAVEKFGLSSTTIQEEPVIMEAP